MRFVHVVPTCARELTRVRGVDTRGRYREYLAEVRE